jgi:translation initiation factor 3 subunit D
MLTVNETAPDPPQEDIEHPNSAFNLARESTRINEDFSQQCLRPELHPVGEPHPFAKPGEEPASVAYRYRSWAISDNLTLVARTQHDAMLEKDEYVTIRALNEWDPKVSAYQGCVCMFSLVSLISI